MWFDPDPNRETLDADPPNDTDPTGSGSQDCFFPHPAVITEMFLFGRCSVLPIERATIVDSGSEEEEDEGEEGESRPAVPHPEQLQLPVKPAAGFCNCALM
jgi:hypothetical protein